jgi:drug/metabolite transporter (DMT)-like permease
MALKIIGVLCVLAGIYFIFMPLTFKDTRVEIPGKVLAVNSISVYSTSDRKYHQKQDVTISYTTPSGTAAQFETTTLPLFASYVVGQAVPVMYDPNTTIAGIKDPNSKWYLSGFLILFGIVFLFGHVVKRPATFASTANPLNN